ncbi:hypothetical protein FGIG_04456, partial [Fasciola gigantica]
FIDFLTETEQHTYKKSVYRLHREFINLICVSKSLNPFWFLISFQRLSKEQTQLLASLSNVKEKLQVSCEKNASLVDEISVLRSKLDLSEKTNHDQASTVTRLESRVNALESELSNKNNLLSKTQDLLSGEQEQKISESQMGQMQQRLKTSGFPTPIPPLPNGNGRLFSPAFGTGMSAGWQTVGSRLTSNLTGSTQTGITPGASSVLGTSSRPVSSVPVAFAGLSSTGTSTVPTSALHQVPKSEYEMGYKKSIKTVESGNSNSLKSTEANPCNLPAPVTKSTPLHGDHMLTSNAYPCDGPGRSVRTTTATTTASAGDMNSRLPAYLPSVLTLRSQTNQNQATTSVVPRVPYPDRISQEAGRPTAATTTSACSGPDESERTLHQQSLSSAYFPKPVGVQSQR